LELLAQASCDVFVTDYEMPNIDGVQLLGTVRAQFPKVRRVVLSGRSVESAVGLPPNVVQAWVCKGHGIDELVEAVEDLMTKAAVFTQAGTG
jgi:DNA-binding NarL/FixJ family response regulator